MIKTFEIKAPKDKDGYYIVPNDVLHKNDMMDNLRYHQNTMKPVQNIMFAIICTVNQDVLKKEDTSVDGWTWNYVRINNILLFFENFFLDVEENILYELGSKNELVILQRHLKLKKMLCGLR